MKSEESVDVIVIGLGGVGSATVAALAADGYRVIGIDQFSPPHQRGSSHGQTRVIRKAYFEHPDYVPMLLRAYDRWKQLEADSGKQLYFPVGLLQIGPIDGEVLAGVRRSALEHSLDVQYMTMQEAQSQYPGIQGDPTWSAIVEHDAGYLLVEQCIEAHLQQAQRHGASLRLNQCVRDWSVDGSGVQVVTDSQILRADRLVIAAGPWADKSLKRYQLPLRVLRKHVYWYQVEAGHYQSSNFPCFFFDTPQGFFYGIPQVANAQGTTEQETSARGTSEQETSARGASSQGNWRGLKIGRHTGGQLADPEVAFEHPEDAEDQSLVEQFLMDCMPAVTRNRIAWQGCYYTMTPDQHFIVDRLPDCPQVSVVAGLSGHGFKFTCVLGEIAANLATDRPSPVSIDFLSLTRFT